MSYAQLMSQFIPGNLVGCQSVVMARFSVYKSEASCNDTDISVIDKGDSQSQ